MSTSGEPISRNGPEFICRGNCVARVSIPLRPPGLSGERLRTALAGVGFESRPMGENGIRAEYFTLTHGTGPDRIDVEIVGLNGLRHPSPFETSVLLSASARYEWIVLVWKGQIDHRIPYEHGPDGVLPQTPPLPIGPIDVFARTMSALKAIAI